MNPKLNLILSLLFASLAALHAAEPKLNVLLILSDDHSYPHVGCYGNKDILTPNLDKFAADGMRFDRAYVTCPQCVPSRASIFTGRSPVAIAMSRFSAPLPRDIKTYPEALRAAAWFANRSLERARSSGQPHHHTLEKAALESSRLSSVRYSYFN